MDDASMYWTTAAFSLVATWLNIRKDPMCFALWLMTNAIWCVADFTHGLPAQGTLHAAYFVLAVWGLVRWMHDERRPPSSMTGVLHGTQARS